MPLAEAPKHTTGRSALIKALSQRQWSQAELAKRLGIQPGVVSRWINGERIPILRFALQLEELLGVKPNLWRLSIHKTILKNGRSTSAHRVIVEKKIGRRLRREEQVHHKNEIPGDNRFKNLALCRGRKEHAQLHTEQSLKRPLKKEPRLLGVFRTKESISLIAKRAGVSIRIVVDWADGKDVGSIGKKLESTVMAIRKKNAWTQQQKMFIRAETFVDLRTIQRFLEDGVVRDSTARKILSTAKSLGYKIPEIHVRTVKRLGLDK